MTKKHFEVIASILAEFRHEVDYDTHQQLCEEFAERLARFNPLFDEHKFLKACGATN